MLDDQAAAERPGHGRDAPHAREVTLDLAALLGRVEVADDRDADRLYGAGSHALDQPKQDE